MANAAIKHLILRRAGLHPESIGPRNIERAVAAAMERVGLRNEAEYLNLLNSSAAELQALLDALVVPETWFFRDREPFVFLTRHVVSAWLPFRPARQFRVLSAPCSTGEEAYSIAITLLEAGLTPERIHIDAVDISACAIATARRADYRMRAFRSEMDERHARYFQRTAEGYVLDRRVARLVNFRVDNLVHPVFLARQDPYQVVFCRNMVIYLSDEARTLVLNNLARLIVPHGILVAGHSELAFFQQAGYTPVAHARSFACIQGGEAEREKARRAPPAPARKTPPSSSVAHAVAEPSPPGRPQAGLEAARRLADQGNLAAAHSLCEQYLKDQSPCAEAYCLLGLISQASDRMDAAEDYYLKALYLDPGCVEALVHLGLCCERRGDSAKAALVRERVRRIEEAVTSR